MGLNCCKPRRKSTAPADSKPPVMAPADSKPPVMESAHLKLPVMSSDDSETIDLSSDDSETIDLSSDDSETIDLSSAYRRIRVSDGIRPRFKLPSWEEDINNLPDEIDDETPINIPAATNVISETEPISMTVSTERSEERGTGGLDPYAPNHSLSDVKSLYDACKSGDTEKIFKLHAKCPELLSQNSNQYLLGIVESGNIDCYIAIESLLLKGKGEEERQQYIGSIRDTDNESVLHKACRSGSKDMYAYISTTYPNLVADKNYLLEIARSKSDLYDIIEKEYEINKK